MTQLIKQLLEIADTVIVETGFDEISNRLQEMKAIALSEGFMNNHRGDLDRKFDELEDKLIAARRELGSTNNADLTPEEKKEYRAKVMRHINFFRRQLQDVMQELGMSEKEKTFHMNRIGLDREFGKPSEMFTRQQDQKPEEKRFTDVMNRERNFAKPEDMQNIVRPKRNDPPAKKMKWYQRFWKY